MPGKKNARTIVCQTPWSRLETVAPAGEKPTSAELVIEGYIGFDGEKWWDGKEQDTTKEFIRKELQALAELNVPELTVRINSLGGSILHGISIHDLLAQFKGTVVTVVEGMTASSATIIAQAGKTRKISDNALYLVHKPMNWAYGNENELAGVLDDLRASRERMEAIYTKRGVNPETLAELLEAQNGNGRWISAAQAKEFGFADEVYEPRDAAAAKVDRQALALLRLPVPEQTAQSGKGVPAPPESKSTVASGPTHKQEFQAMLNPEQVKKMQALFGAEAACHAVAENLDFDAAILAAAEAQATALTAARAEIQTKAEALAKAEKELAEAKAQIAAHAKGRTDPLAGHTQPPPADPDAEAKAKADAEAKADADKRAALDAFAKNR